jgi:geranylgeranyl diphosphate synthase type 3
MTDRSDGILLEPFLYLQRIPGKNVRSLLIDAFNSWLCVPTEKVDVIKDIVGKLHNASLLIDDIEDNSKQRRGVPVAHAIYGIPATINCANYVYFIALDQAMSLGSVDACRGFLDEMMHLHQGQGEDIYWRDTNTCPSEQQYERMVQDKTGGLFRLAVRLMLAFSSDPPLGEAWYLELASQLGLYFQILDDYLNLQSDTYAKNKSFCEDLTEGKYSFPIIHCIHAMAPDRRLSNILRQKTEDLDIKRYALRLMQDAGSFEYTKTRLVKLHSEIVEMLERNPVACPLLKGALESWRDSF